MKEALELTGLKTKKEAVELGLQTLIKLKKQEKLQWKDDLEYLKHSR